MGRKPLPGMSESIRNDITDQLITAATSITNIVDTLNEGHPIARADDRRLRDLCDGAHARIVAMRAYMETGHFIPKPKTKTGEGGQA